MRPIEKSREPMHFPLAGNCPKPSRNRGRSRRKDARNWHLVLISKPITNSFRRLQLPVILNLHFSNKVRGYASILCFMVSVLIIIYRRLPLLHRTVALFEHTDYSRLMSVVADDCSRPEVQEQVRNLPVTTTVFSQLTVEWVQTIMLV